jgi:SAM domain (Sterile alpha motif)
MGGADRKKTGQGGAAMPIDVADWLRGLGLGQYAPGFAANDIDHEILPALTADDLIGLGVASIGHRRKLLSAKPNGGSLPYFFAISLDRPRCPRSWISRICGR